MLPSVVVAQVRESLLDYLRTTFQLRDAKLEEALFRFLVDAEEGLFRGPYLDVRLPFRKAEPEAELPLDVGPPFTPYLHQLRAFERLTSRDGHRPLATLVTTGTGSGKTECFLYPVLDHCRRERQRGKQGIKALILYPMNALASDQAERLARELQRPELRGVSAGLYVGGKGSHGEQGPTYLVDKRDVLRKSPPDILLTNYMMLDLLLLRPEDRSLWASNGPTTLQYLVLDELHTYDGAQGSDVACLLRRLKERLAIPPGHLTGVGTSATIGGGGPGGGADEPRRLLVEFASKVFGEPFDETALIGEDRLTVRETFPVEVKGFNDPIELAPGGTDPLDPEQYETPTAYVEAQARLWVNWESARRVSLGDQLGSHHFLRALLHALRGRDGVGGPRHWLEVADLLGRGDPKFAEQPRERQWLILSSFLALLAHARRDEGGREVPLLTVRVELWIRELRGLVRLVHGDEVRLAWRDDLEAQPHDHWLPIVYCRECGHSGLGSVQREAEQRLRDAGTEVGNAYLRRESTARFITLNAKADGELQSYLCPRCLRLLEGMRHCDCTPPGEDGSRAACIPVEVTDKLTEEKRFRDDCPQCGAEHGLSMLGSRAASLSSVAVSRLYLTPHNQDKKLLAFTDSVQDASHRAGFFAARTFRFTMRTAIQTALEAAQAEVPLLALPRRVLDYWVERLTEPRAIASLMPPDLREEPAYAAYTATEKPTKRIREPVLALLLKRLEWEVAQEYGLGIIVGRSLDRTACSTLAVEPDRLKRAAERLTLYLEEERPVLKRGHFDQGEVRHFLDGIVQRLRHRGGIYHPLLARYVKTGQRFFLSKVKEPVLPRFGRQARVPTLLFVGRSHDLFDALLSKPGQYTWHRDWTARSLALSIHDGELDTVLTRALDALVEAGVAGRYPSGKAQAAGLDMGALVATTRVVRLACGSCGQALTLREDSAHDWRDRRCTRYRCAGTYVDADDGGRGASYYRRLYRSGNIARIFAGEHTGLLERSVREKLEIDFKTQARADAPNLLTCTPTLEMGIDIGDLSSVLLCSVPPLPANYLQRVGRAGRKTGNASVLTMVTARPHDLYFNSSPTEMLRGEVTPPGCFLDAPEVLMRQLLAHAMDRWARDGGVDKLPPTMKLLPRIPKEGSFPHAFYAFYAVHGVALLEQFLALFADQVTPPNVERLRAAAADGALVRGMQRAYETVHEERVEIRKRLGELDARAAQIAEDPSLAEPNTDESLDPESRAALELEEIRDARAAYLRVLEELGKKHPLQVLTDASVLPNYAFPEQGVTLKALLRGPRGDGAAKPSEIQRYEYLRPASRAIREFAPFNTFYAEGHKVRVSQVDVGSRARPLVETWRLCPVCHHALRILEDHHGLEACTRCGSPQFKDQGQKRRLVHFRQAWSAMDLMEASTAEDTEEREEVAYKLVELIDVEAKHLRGGWLVQNDELVFGYELLQGLTLRELNLGVQGDRGNPLEIAGAKLEPKGFRVCRDCGKVQPRKPPKAGTETRAEHAPYCKVRTTPKTREEFETIFLYRELTSEAIRVLLPVSDYGVEKMLPTVSAALELGFRRKFRGQAAHLRITTATETIGGTRRRYLIVYDTVPGGTGYLSELAKGVPAEGSGLLEVMELALEHMRDCSCARDEARDGCYRCVYAYQSSYDLANISRRDAVALFEQVLRQRRQLVPKASLSGVTVDAVLESELERRFIDALAKHAETQRWGFGKSFTGGKVTYRLTLPTLTWVLEPQVELGPSDGVGEPCRPDFVARCVTRDDVLPLAVFCDGLEFHVCPDRTEGRLWDDLRKRESILRSGSYWVWSVTWKDVSDFSGDTRYGATTLFAPLNSRQHEGTAARLEQGLGRPVPRGLADLDGMEQLVRFLVEPDAPAWGAACAALGAGLLALQRPLTVGSITALRRGLRTEAERSEVAVEYAAAPAATVAGWEARAGAELLVELPLTELKRAAFGGLEATLRLFDDAADRGAEGFEESWRAALHALNLLQFHGGPRVVTSTELLRREAAEDGAPQGTPPPAARPPSTPPDAARPLSDFPAVAAGHAALSRISDEYPEARPLVHELLARALPAPEEYAGHASDRVELDAILAWPTRRVALWYDVSPADRAAWERLGWQVFGVETDAPEVIADAVAAAGARWEPRPAPQQED